MNQQLVIGGILAAGGFVYLRAKADISPGAEPGLGTATVPPNAPSTVLEWKSYAMEAGAKFNVSPQLVLAVIWQESYGMPGVTGSVGEIGLMQITENAAIDAGWASAVRDPKANIYIGTSYLRLQYDRWRKRSSYMKESDLWYNALRAYNAGFYGSTTSDQLAQGYALEVLQKAGWR